jgi:hypothetical protein
MALEIDPDDPDSERHRVYFVVDGRYDDGVFGRRLRSTVWWDSAGYSGSPGSGFIPHPSDVERRFSVEQWESLRRADWPLD